MKTKKLLLVVTLMLALIIVGTGLAADPCMPWVRHLVRQSSPFMQAQEARYAPNEVYAKFEGMNTSQYGRAVYTFSPPGMLPRVEAYNDFTIYYRLYEHPGCLANMRWRFYNGNDQLVHTEIINPDPTECGSVWTGTYVIENVGSFNNAIKTVEAEMWPSGIPIAVGIDAIRGQTVVCMWWW